MDWKKLADQAKAVVDKRGGSQSVKEDAEELKDIAQGQGSMSDKLKSAAEAIKEPGAHQGPGANPPSQPTQPSGPDESG
jgi:hypothetical protein